MATWTVAETRNRVLEHLQKLAVGETASAADASIVDEAITAARNSLDQLNVVEFDTAAVPEWAQLPWRDYVATKVASSFGLDAQRRTEHEARGQMALRDLRALTEAQWNSQPVEGRYF